MIFGCVYSIINSINANSIVLDVNYAIDETSSNIEMNAGKNSKVYINPILNDRHKNHVRIKANTTAIGLSNPKDGIYCYIKK